MLRLESTPLQNMKNTTWFAPWWKELPKRWGHPWHSMCSYLAMFPPALPRYFIEQCSRPGDTVLDPFSGRGTVPLEACLAGRVGIGSDANPLASLLTAAKVRPAGLSRLLARVAELKSQYSRRKVSAQASPDIQMLFDGRRTLPQLLFVRDQLAIRSACDRFLLATLCGILHGNHPADRDNNRTLSISMPNTFCMSPGYIKRYIVSHRLRKHPSDVFDRLERRLLHLFREGAPGTVGRAEKCDARRISSWVKRESVSLIVTSPPYLRAIRYGKYNWIRLWLLRELVEDVDRRVRVERSDKRLALSDQLSLPHYCDFLEASLQQCSRALKPGGYCVVVLGDIRSASGEDLNLAKESWSRIKRNVNLQLEGLMTDSIEVSEKVTRIWGNRKGSATKTDRILLLKKPGRNVVRHASPPVLLDGLR